MGDPKLPLMKIFVYGTNSLPKARSFPIEAANTARSSSSSLLKLPNRRTTDDRPSHHTRKSGKDLLSDHQIPVISQQGVIILEIVVEW
jgi:hypothetical protein